MPSLRVMEENERLQLSLSIPFFITAGHSQGITKPLMSFCKRRPSRWRLFTRLSVHDACRYPTSCNVMSNVKDHVCGNTALGAFSSVHEEDGDVKMPINRTICRKKKTAHLFPGCSGQSVLTHNNNHQTLFCNRRLWTRIKSSQSGQRSSSRGLLAVTQCLFTEDVVSRYKFYINHHKFLLSHNKKGGLMGRSIITQRSDILCSRPTIIRPLQVRTSSSTILSSQFYLAALFIDPE